MSEEDYLAAVASLQAEAMALSALDTGILAALRLGIVSDSHGFARTFGIAHALALRAVTELAGAGFVEITARDSRTQRTAYVLSATGIALCETAGL